MKKINLAVFGTIMLFSSICFSQEKMFDAIGYESFYEGVSLKKNLQNNRNLQIIFGMYYETKRENDDDAEFDLRGALRLRSQFADLKKVRIEKFVEGGLIIDDTHQQDRSRTDIHISVGLIPEIFITEKFSFEIPIGVGLLLQGESRPNAGDNSTQIFTFGSGLNLGVSFHVYF